MFAQIAPAVNFILFYFVVSKGFTFQQTFRCATQFAVVAHKVDASGRFKWHRDVISLFLIFQGYQLYFDKARFRCENLITNVLIPTSKIKMADGKTIARVEEKPLDLIKELIERYSDRDDLVADLFLGTGTTASACMRTGRKFIGCDVDHEIIKIASVRILKTLNHLFDISNINYILMFQIG